MDNSLKKMSETQKPVEKSAEKKWEQQKIAKTFIYPLFWINLAIAETACLHVRHFTISDIVHIEILFTKFKTKIVSNTISVLSWSKKESAFCFK